MKAKVTNVLLVNPNGLFLNHNHSLKRQKAMKIAKGIKTVRKVTETKVFDDFGKLVNAVELYVIIKLEENKGMKGFTVSFKTYSETFGNGGFETTLWFANASMDKVEMLLGAPSTVKRIASQIGAELTSYKTNNRVK